MPVKQVSICKTDGEWRVIKQKLADAGTKNLVSHITCESKKLIDKFKECPSCITSGEGKRREKRPYLPQDVYDNMTPIAAKMKVPIATAIDRLIISPMLLPK